MNKYLEIKHKYQRKYEELDKEKKKEIKKLQEKCKHLKVTEPEKVLYQDLIRKKCLDCMKIVEESKI